jgi:dipeptidyl aminopeptidase/acylaminoacyl peptidase
MKRINLAITILAAAGAIATGSVRAQISPTAAEQLKPIAFLTTHEWDAKLPDSPDGKKIKIHARFSWAQNRQAIRVSNEFVTDGHGSPYIEGLYAWDPQQRVIVFCYVDAKGGLTKGTVKSEDGQLVHEFQETQPDGQTAQYVARVTPHKEEAWDNEIFARKGDTLTAVVKVHYEIAQ